MHPLSSRPGSAFVGDVALVLEFATREPLRHVIRPQPETSLRRLKRQRRLNPMGVVAGNKRAEAAQAGS